MATFYFKAVSAVITYDSSTQVRTTTSVDGNADLQVDADAGSGFSYSYDPASLTGLATIQNSGAFSMDLGGQDPIAAGFDTYIFDTDWSFGGVSGSTTIMELDSPFALTSATGYQSTQSLVVLGGDDLPALSSVSEFEDFINNSIVSQSQASGTLAPDQTILWSELPYFDLVDDTAPQGLRIIGSKIDDFLIGSDGDDTIRGRGGADGLHGLAGADDLNGGSGKDTVSYALDAENGGKSGVKVNLQKGKATDGFGDTDKLANFQGVIGTSKGDKLTGDKKLNVLQGEKGDDKLYGLDGNDILQGGGGNDVIKGGGGRDTINGGKSNDKLTGGGEVDVFDFDKKFGDDTITDFDALARGEKIDLSDVGAIKNFKDLKKHHMSTIDGDVVIDDLKGNTITLTGVNISDLDTTDFIF